MSYIQQIEYSTDSFQRTKFHKIVYSTRNLLRKGPKSRLVDQRASKLASCYCFPLIFPSFISTIGTQNDNHLAFLLPSLIPGMQIDNPRLSSKIFCLRSRGRSVFLCTSHPPEFRAYSEGKVHTAGASISMISIRFLAQHFSSSLSCLKQINSREREWRRWCKRRKRNINQSTGCHWRNEPPTDCFCCSTSFFHFFLLMQNCSNHHLEEREREAKIGALDYLLFFSLLGWRSVLRAWIWWEEECLIEKVKLCLLTWESQVEMQDEWGTQKG